MYDDYYINDYDDEDRYWTRRRFVVAIMAFILLLVFLIYTLQPVIHSLSIPSPTQPPAPMIRSLGSVGQNEPYYPKIFTKGYVNYPPAKGELSVQWWFPPHDFDEDLF